jgi:hypothetical protein
MRIAFLSLLLAAAVTGPAWSQPAPTPTPTPAPARDEIGDLLDPHHVAAPGDEDEPDTAGQTRTVPEPESSILPAAPAPRAYTPAPRPQLNAPVRIEETGKTPDGPLSLGAMAYDSRIRSSFASAQSFQGPLDGGWTLSEQRGGDHYALQIVDRRDRLEAVWRDVRRAGSLNASGLVDDIQRTGGALTLRFTEAPSPASVVTLHEGAGGRWTGELVRGDQISAVTLRRSGP